MSQAASRKLRYGTKAAIGVVLLAMLLASVGLVMAVRHTRLSANQRVNEVRGMTEGLARDLHTNVREQVSAALAQVVASIRARRASGEPVADPMGGDRRPSWLGDLFGYDGQDLNFWPGLDPPHGGTARYPERDRRLRSLAEAILMQQLFLAPFTQRTDQAVLQPDHLGAEPILLAHLLVEDPGRGPLIVGASLDLSRLREQFLTPLVAQASPRIRLTEAGMPSPAWSEPLTPAMPFWALQPTPEFVDRTRGSVRRQTGVLVGVTVLALIALLVVVWGLIHVVRREVALSDLKSSFVADVSHELKTPLALIRLFGETLAQGRVTAPEKRQEYYEIITRESARLTHLINNILDFSRIGAGRKEYKLQPIDVGQVVGSTYESYRFDLDHNRFEHRLEVAPDLPRVQADADAISQALLNLMSNAIKYCDDERFLSVEVTPETRRGRHGVLISVRDRGIGIKPEVRRRLFEGFYRGSDDLVRQRRGAGLGLALVKHIVDAHGGSVDVESRLVKGSTFRIFLPENPPEDGRSPAE
jgi:signal transduction histidine kinase